MNEYVKNYFLRGLIFGGFGPIVMAIVLFILQLSGVYVVLNGTEVFTAIISTYILAFVQAGSTVFNQIENWSVAKSMLFHFVSIYLAYVVCYLINNWLPFDLKVVAIFTAIFIVAFLIIWLTVYFIVKRTSNKLNNSIR